MSFTVIAGFGAGAGHHRHTHPTSGALWTAVYSDEVTATATSLRLRNGRVQGGS